MHLLLLALLCQAPVPGAPSSPPPAPEEGNESLFRPEDFTLSDPGAPAHQGTMPGDFALDPPDPESLHGEAKDSGFDFIPVPIAAFNSDTGFGLGVVLLAYIYGKDYRPYRFGITAQFLATTTGFQGHYIAFDAPHLIGPVRVEARFEFHKDLYAPYYGPGNHTFPGESLEGPDKFFGYLNVWTSDWVRLRVKPLGDAAPFTVYAGYEYRYHWVTPYADSVLARERPTGIGGGRNGKFFGGLLWDTRDDEQNAHSGFLVQVGRKDCPPPDRERVELSGRHFRHPHVLLALDSPAGPRTARRGGSPLGGRSVLGVEHRGRHLRRGGDRRPRLGPGRAPQPLRGRHQGLRQRRAPLGRGGHSLGAGTGADRSVRLLRHRPGVAAGRARTESSSTPTSGTAGPVAGCA